MTTADIERALAGTGIGDVLIAGFVDRNDDGRVQFWPTYYAYFLECGAVLLKFSADPDTGRMRISRVDAVRDDLDPDLEPAWASIGTAVLENSIGPTPLRGPRLWGVDETPDGVECDAAQFDLANGQTIFLGQTYHFGIRLGGDRQHSLWLENLPGDEPKSVDLDLSQGD
jgi:hypothetical protein